MTWDIVITNKFSTNAIYDPYIMRLFVVIVDGISTKIGISFQSMQIETSYRQIFYSTINNINSERVI